jgi:acyl-CoA synthetase (AMP-forming)/AMP-acid ligase II
VAIILTMLRVGGCVLMQREFKARDFLELASRERMTFTLVVPAIYNLCLRDPDFSHFDLGRWRLGGFGGAPMPEGTIRALAQKLPRLTLVNAYGATETTSPTTSMPLGLQADHLDSVGITVPCGEVRVMDDAGREVPRGAPGEIWIAGPMVVPGYWADLEATGRDFCDGYWKSGDIGSIDADGYVRVFDRKKDMINRGGYKVYCAEVENVLSLHPAVTESALIARADPVLGEKTHAFVSRSDPAFTEDALRAHCARHLADYKIPDFITFVGRPLPRNANGKLLKRQLRENMDQTLPAAGSR